MWLRSALNLGLRALLLAVIGLQLAYLLRRPLCERLLCAKLAQLARAELGCEVAIARLGGDWVTTVIAEGVQLRADGVLQQVDDAVVAVEVDPWRLARGDLSGVRRARVHARSLTLRLTGNEANTTPGPAPTVWPALGDFAHLLPAGADIAVDTLSLHAATTLSSPVRLVLAHERSGLPRRLALDGLGLQVDVDLPRRGDLAASVRTGDVGRCVHLFAPMVELAGGRAQVDVTGSLSPSPAASARVRLGDLTVVGLGVERLTAKGLVTVDGVRSGDADFTLHGTRGELRGIAFAFTELPWPQRGLATLHAGDTAPWRAFLTPALARELPHARSVRVRGAFARQRLDVDVDAAIDARGQALPDVGHLTLHAHAGQEGDATAVAVLDAGSTALAARGSLTGVSLRGLFAAPDATLTAPLHAEVVVRAGDLQRAVLRRFGVQAHGHLAIDATLTGSLAHLEPDLTVNAFDLAVGAPSGPPWIANAALRARLARHALHIDGAVARVAGEYLTLAGGATLRDDQLTFTGLHVLDAHGGQAELAGSVLWPPSDWKLSLRTGADLRVTVTDFKAAPWLALDAMGVAGLRLSGALRWRTQGTVDLRLFGHGEAERGDAPALPLRATFALRGDAQTTMLDIVHADAGGVIAEGAGRVACSPLALLDGLDALLTAPVVADVYVPALTLRSVPAHLLRQLGLDELRGQVSGQGRLRGTLASPDIQADLQVAAGALRTLTGERVDDIEASVNLTPRTARITGSASRGKGPLALAGSLSATQPLWQAGASADLDLALQGSNVLLHRQAGVRVRGDLDLLAHGRLDDLVLRGNIALRDSKLVTRVPLFDLRRSGGATASTGLQLPGLTLPEPLRARLEVAITSKDPFAVKTNVLEGNLNAQLELRGPTSAPRLQGTITGPDSTVILPGMRLKATALLLQFTNDNPTLPTLTLTARGRRHGYDVQVTARGRYDRPDIEFSADPPLPPDELVVLVTTGARPSALRSTTGVGTVLGTYAAQEFADWVFGSESTEAKEGFLDRFTVETGTEMSKGGNESIVVEFRLGDRVVLQAERDVYEDINMGVVYRVRFR